MREIKFRAWDKPGKQMYSVSEIGFAEGGYIYRINVWDKIEAMERLLINDFELMQFTGLLDKNGVEIYEGDIVKYEGDYEGDYWRKGGNGSVTFDDGCYFVESKTDCFEIDSASIKNKGIEVIGNIYENPELLEEIP